MLFPLLQIEAFHHLLNLEFALLSWTSSLDFSYTEVGSSRTTAV